MRTTLYDIRYNSRIPENLNVPPTDTRIVSWVNEATQRLMTRGLYWGAYATMDVSVTSTLMTLPPQLETLETIALSKTPLPIRDTFYQFIESGWGQRDETNAYGSGIQECLYLNNFPVITDITTASVLKVVCDQPTDAAKTVLLLGYDQNGNWIRTTQSGVMADGEVVALSQAGTNTASQFSKVTDIQPPSTLDGQWWLYQGTTMLGNYQHWELRPSYKRYLIPYVSGSTSTARVVGRRSYVPVKNDNDYLIIGNLAAMKLAMLACRAEEMNEWDKAQLLWNGGETKTGQKLIGALQELDFELQYQLGVGRQVTIDNHPYYYEPLGINSDFTMP